MSTVFLLILVAYLGRWVVAGWSDTRRIAPGDDAEVARLRDEVDQLTTQVARLADEQHFLMRLLAEGGQRPLPELPPTSPDEETR
ncbi:MAG TPA: hypothetical protein VE913_09735 [Longimicrobium sp.]|nr:hypothetical protein [Longimicrobium sp.]